MANKIIYFDCLYRTGRPKGYAFVYLQDAKDIDKAIEYVDGRHIKGR